MPSKRLIRHARRRLGRALPLFGLLGWIYGLPGFFTDGRWWWQSASQVGVAVAVVLLSMLALSAVLAFGADQLSAPRVRAMARRVLAIVT